MSNGLPTFLKWAGGKTQLIEQFKPLLPKKIERYFEPFLGSGAIFFFVRNNFKPKKCFISDINEELITAFLVIRDNVNELIKELEKIKNDKQYNTRNYYNEIRSLNPKKLSNIEATARMIYLNKTCFNGLYRVNSNGEFNVPFGKYKNPKIFDKKNLLEASKLLQGVEIEVSQFENVLKSTKSGDFVYFDPPYLPISKTSSFTNYTKNRFLQKEQQNLAEIFKKLDKKGCKVMLSNSDHQFIKDLYKGFKIKTVEAKRSISCIGTKRGKIKEIVVRNYDD